MRKRAKNSIHGNKQYTWKHLIPAQNIKIHKIKKIKDCTVCVKKRMLNSFVCSVPMFIFLFLYALKNKIRKDFNPPPPFLSFAFFLSVLVFSFLSTSFRIFSRPTSFLFCHMFVPLYSSGFFFLVSSPHSFSFLFLPLPSYRVIEVCVLKYLIKKIRKICTKTNGCKNNLIFWFLPKKLNPVVCVYALHISASCKTGIPYC